MRSGSRAAIGAPADKLAEIVARLLDSYTRTDYPYMFIFLQEDVNQITADPGDPWAREMNQLSRRYEQAITAIIEEGVAAGDFSLAGPPHVLTKAVIGMANWTHRWYRSDGTLSAAQIADTFVQTFLHGVTTSQETVVMTIDDAGRVFTQPKAYADEARFHATCAQLRRKSPVHRVEADGFTPFWAVTRHADVLEIERGSDRWLERAAAGARPEERDEKRGTDMPIRTLVQMDAPDHTVYRHMTVEWFKPGNIARLGDRAAELAKRSVDRMAELDGGCDFVTDIAVHYPLSMILSLLGLPEEDYPRMLQLTQELFGTADPELGRGTDGDALLATLLDFFEYFKNLTESRRAHPSDDLASVIANAEVDGEPIGIMEAVGYYVLIATAGHDTTSSAIAGGLLALVEHPEQLQRLLDDPERVPTAVEEMFRWVSPVKQFMRTATEDSVVHDVAVPAGDAVLLSYPSANRDEDVFDQPQEFDVTRDPNRHVAFGFGAHYCLGTHLARLEARALYRELIPRLRSIELAGEPAFMETLFVGGPKHLPIRYELA